jgi:hypothetical protein
MWHVSLWFTILSFLLLIFIGYLWHLLLTYMLENHNRNHSLWIIAHFPHVGLILDLSLSLCPSCFIYDSSSCCVIYLWEIRLMNNKLEYMWWPWICVLWEGFLLPSQVVSKNESKWSHRLLYVFHLPVCWRYVFDVTHLHTLPQKL